MRAHRRREDRRENEAEQSVRHVLQNEGRENVIGLRKAVIGSIQRPQPDADHEEERELQRDDDTTADDRNLSVAQRLGREKPLHNQLVGAM